MAKNKPTSKKNGTKKSPQKQSRRRGYSGPARLLLEPVLGNPDYPHDREVVVEGSCLGTDNQDIKWSIKDDAGLVADGSADPVANTTDRFTITIPANTLNDGSDVYILKAKKDGVLPASLVLDTLG